MADQRTTVCPWNGHDWIVTRTTSLQVHAMPEGMHGPGMHGPLYYVEGEVVCRRCGVRAVAGPLPEREQVCACCGRPR